MKKELKIKLLIVFFCSLVIGLVGAVGYNIGEDIIFRARKVSSDTGTINISRATVEVEILEINKDNIIVHPTFNVPEFLDYSPNYQDEYAFLHTDKLLINLKKVDTVCDLEVGKIVNIVYKFKNGVKGENPIELNTVELIEEVEDWENIVLYNGRRYHKRFLSEDTLKWLEMSEEERANWDYYPKKLEEIGRISLSNEVMDWGLILKPDNVTPTGMTVIAKQEDFIPTTLNDDWQFSTDSYFRIEKLKNKRWENASFVAGVLTETVLDDIYKVQNISPNGETVLEFDWHLLYGELEKGEYCLEQKLKVLRGPHDYDWWTVWIPFTVE